MSGEVTTTEYFMAMSPAGSECLQPRAGTSHQWEGEQALIILKTLKKQTPQLGRELLTGTDEPPHSISLQASYKSAKYLLPNTRFWVLGTSAGKGTYSSHSVVAPKSGKRNSTVLQGKALLFLRNQIGIGSVSPWEASGDPFPWSQSGCKLF